MSKLLAAGLCLALGGCAKFPAALDGDGARRLLDLRMTVRGAIDENAYYLFVIDTDGRDTDGPEIIAPRTEFLGNGRATGSYTHYVEYHLGRFELFRDQPEVEGQVNPPREALGPPFSSDATSSAGSLLVTIDLDQLKPNANDPDLTDIEVNFITVNQIVLPGELPILPRQTDGIGLLGTDYLAIRLENGLVITNDGLEGTGELFENQQLEAPYDLADFRVAVREGS